MPEVSVVIPTFGRPDLLRRALASALAQTMANLEVIVVVDGADPASLAAVAACGDGRVVAISHESRRGAAEARTTGVEASRGAWIAFLDDDDAWLPGKLAAQLAHAPPRPAIITTLSRVGTADAASVKPVRPYDGSVPVDEWLFDRRSWLGSGGFVQSSSLLVPRAVFETIRFSEMRHHDDWEFVIRAVKQAGLDLVTVPEALVLHLFDDARTSLQSTLTWTRSIEWARRMQTVMTARALSGFLLTVAARSAANADAREAVRPLLRAAFALGRPTARQLFAFALLWILPRSMRRAARQLTGRGRGALQAGAH